ncbi:hypothetical protein GGS20DRAFT_581248 [Poronia punctata]|nr:hypothetical protein GGS20DRAFT_581248 [Poronia punctata]
MESIRARGEKDTKNDNPSTPYFYNAHKTQGIRKAKGIRQTPTQSRPRSHPASMPQPQFIFVELPSFRIKDKNNNSVNLSTRQLGHVLSRLQYMRHSTQAGGYIYPDLCVSILFGGGETDIWTSSHTQNHGGQHAEENLLLTYFQSFDSPGAYPIIDSMLLAAKPCSSCMEYFSLSGKLLRPQDRTLGSFRAKFTPRSDKSYTPVFYLSRSLSDVERSDLWLQLGQMTSPNAIGMGLNTGLAHGQVYYLYGDGIESPWYALNGQDNMTDSEIVEAIVRQGTNPMFWAGR